MKRLYFDARIIQDPRYSNKGLGYYSAHLLDILRPRLSDRIDLIVDPSLDNNLKILSQHDRLSFAQSESMKDGIYLCPSLMTHHLFPLTTALHKGIDVVAVIHDLIPLRRPVQEVGALCYMRFKKALDISETFRLLIANSYSTRDDFLSTRPSPASMIVVRPRSRFEHNVSTSRQTMFSDNKGKYVLFGVANHERKNVESCLAVAPFFHSIGLDVIATGGIGPDDLEALVGNRADNGVRFLPVLSNVDLLSAYQNSRAVVIPSFDEGFSMHVLEAHSARRPVIASDIPAHREQISDPARLFDPHSPASLIKAFKAACNSDVPTMHPIDHESEEEDLLGRLEALLA